MLAKILEDMWVDPEVLQALSEEQKRILFLKMREEQVRRWREREEREERGRPDTAPKKASSKRVSWLLGRDGDVSVSVIGEMDEFRSSKLLRSLMDNSRRSDSMNGIQPGRQAQQLSFKEDVQLPLTDVTNDLETQNEPSSEEDVDSYDLQDPVEDSDSESGSSLDNLSDWASLYRPHLCNHGNQAPLSDPERAGPESGADVFCEEKKPESGGRVAELRKTFTADLRSTPSACTKPAKPQKKSSPSE